MLAIIHSSLGRIAAAVCSQVVVRGCQVFEKILETFLKRYGALMTPEHLGEVLHRKYSGIRSGLEATQSLIARGKQREADPFYVGLLAAKKKLGRNVYFDTARVAALIAKPDSSAQAA